MTSWSDFITSPTKKEQKAFWEGWLAALTVILNGADPTLEMQAVRLRLEILGREEAERAAIEARIKDVQENLTRRWQWVAYDK